MKPFRDFDLPTRHLENGKHFVPPKARDEAEIARRRNQRPGVLLTEAQHRGITIAHSVLSIVRTQPDINFTADTLAAANLNTAWYLFGRTAPTMRRRLKLEKLDAEDPEQRPSAYMLQQNASADLSEAKSTSTKLVDATRSGLETADELRRNLGRTLGHSALTLACIPLGDVIGYGFELNNFDVQALARQRGLRALEQARTLAQAIGTPPSIAQLADPISDLSVYWQRNAPNEALEAYHAALEAAA